MKRFVSLFLILAISLVCLSACNGDDKVSDVSIGDTVKDAYKDDSGNYVPRHEVKDLDGRVFNIIVKGSISGTYQSDDFTIESEMYGELIEDAVKKRNDKVEELYNVKLNVIKSDSINSDILNDCQASLGSYDAIMPNLPFLSTLASQEYLCELTSISTFDVNAPWYEKNCSDAFSLGNKLYFTTGDITILNKVNTPSVLFNKEMASKVFDFDFYQLVRDKEWTFDKLVECATDVAAIATPDGSYSKENIYGMVTAHGDPIRFFGGSGETICAKDGDDLPYLTLGETERSLTIAQSILQTYAEANWLIFAEDCEAPVWDTSFEIFYAGRALFRPSVFSATTKMRRLSEIEFGVLPIPLMDETQDTYYSYASTGQTAGIAIPFCAPDPEFSAYMIEAYSAWAKNYLTPAYYEVNLRYRDLRDDESEEMLDIIFGNIVYDIGECFEFGGMRDIFEEMAKSRASDIVSAIDAKKDMALIDIEDLRIIYSN